MKKLSIVFCLFVFCYMTAFCNSDSTIVQLKIVTRNARTNLPLDSVLIKIEIDKTSCDRYTDSDGVASFYLPEAPVYNLTAYKANGPCLTEYRVQKTLQRLNSFDISDTINLRLRHIMEMIAIQSPTIFFTQNSANVYTENLNTTEREGGSLKRFCLHFAKCGFEIHGFASCKELNSEKLARKRAESVIEYLKANKYPYDNFQIVVHAKEGCGCAKTEKCSEEQLQHDRRVLIKVIEHD